MENGYEGNLADKMSGLVVNEQASSSSMNNNNNNSDDSLLQVIKAVEDAEATIKHQVEENFWLKNELQKKQQELERLKLDEAMARKNHSDETWHEQFQRTYEAHHSVSSMGNQEDGMKGSVNAHSPNLSILHIDQRPYNADAGLNSYAQSHSRVNNGNGLLNESAGGQAITNIASLPATSSPSTVSFSPKRHHLEDYDPQLRMPARGLMPITEADNPNNLWEQDLVHKMREHEEEIMKLRKQLSEYSIKEAQVRNEKYVLEKRIASMRLAFDQQQQDLVDATSKSLAYRQNIIEENVRLAYALQAVQEERTTFVSSLLSLLTEYSYQPQVSDAQSIVSNVKVLFKHLQEKLLLTESKLKESEYQLTPWHSDANHSNIAPQSPSHSAFATVTTANTNGLDLVAQPTFLRENLAFPAEFTSDWRRPSQHQSGLVNGVGEFLEPGDLVTQSPLASRYPEANNKSVQFSITRPEGYTQQHEESGGSWPIQHEEYASRQVTFRDPVSSSEIDYSEVDGRQHEPEQPTNWGQGSSPHSNTLEDPSLSYSPYLPTVPEDPSSSYSEAADDDPLPAIKDLQISGEAFPGQELQACGYSVNGTTTCNFEWVRHLEDGSVNYIDGAKQPNYLVTADDVDTYLAIEVQPLDNRKRKGELVKVFANEQRKISCDDEMQSHIEGNLHNGEVSYRVSLSNGDIWEPAILTIKKEGYSIKRSGTSSVIFSEKFTRGINVTIPYGRPTEFYIIGSYGVERLLHAENSSDISCSRDTIVLTLRLFIMRAGKKRTVKKIGLFFH